MIFLPDEVGERKAAYCGRCRKANELSGHVVDSIERQRLAFEGGWAIAMHYGWVCRECCEAGKDVMQLT